MVKRPVSLPQEDEVSVAAAALVWVELEKGGVGLIGETADVVNPTSLPGNGEFAAALGSPEYSGGDGSSEAVSERQQTTSRTNRLAVLLVGAKVLDEAGKVDIGSEVAGSPP